MNASGGSSRLGTRFGPYELQKLIGLGGMGEVYRAYDTARERMVAIKLLRPDMAADLSYQERFRRESRIAARLQEPHVIPVHNFGEIDGVLFIDMRLVEGVSLKDLLQTDGALTPVRAVSIISQVAAALDAAHAGNLVHRDVKPENVLLTGDDFAYLVDFGIAHGGEDVNVTKTGIVIGSCTYMAPERFSGDRGGPASDVYSLTCLLYECLTGRAPYEAADVRQVMSAHMFTAAPRPSSMRREITPAFDDVVARGMAKKPIDRYSTAGAMARAAAAAVTAPAVPSAAWSRPQQTRQLSAALPSPTGTGYVVQAPPSRRTGMASGQMALMVGVVVLFAAAAVLAVVLVFAGADGSQPPAAVGPLTPSQNATTTTTTAGAPIAGVSGTDAQGFVGHAARCSEGDAPAALIRTAQSLAVICEMTPGTYYYHGERLRDGANVRIADAVRNGNGFTATNPSDGARYDVQPDMLTISSNGTVDNAEPAIEYGAR